MRFEVVAALFFALFFLSFETSNAQRRGGSRRGGGRRVGTARKLGGYKDRQAKAYYNHPDAAKIIDWSHFESEYVLGRKIVFMCTAHGNPRPHITWYKNGIELYAHTFFQVHEWKTGENEMKSKMEIDPATQMDAGWYECQADNRYSVDYKAFRTDYLIEFD